MFITTAQTTADLEGILALQQRNLSRNVPPDVQREQVASVSGTYRTLTHTAALGVAMSF